MLHCEECKAEVTNPLDAYRIRPPVKLHHVHYLCARCYEQRTDRAYLLGLRGR